ncbi:hypothetical protein LQV63_28655 [Paenibacillus profundus]|uniref:Uncharacterized protein n=1 Tax=Paenibacillus profundus TaxID=1173085 RepID=A0ABS8YNX0_9BACL|nr:hypothetical protein [Paenibacillus profundus]MCE5173237.1 hypothetical protein [Paenibacillus profundus]
MASHSEGCHACNMAADMINVIKYKWNGSTTLLIRVRNKVGDALSIGLVSWLTIGGNIESKICTR